MTNPRKPSDYDWVAARAACSPLNMLSLLKADAEKNVAAIKAATKAEGREIFLSVFDNGHSFGVVRRTHVGEIGVRFTLYRDEIAVESQGVDVGPFTATLTLDDDGDCRLLVGGQMLDRWQVLRRALEPLFFRA
jgi:hypothetical protein